MFNIRRLQAQTKVSSDTSFDLQYADHAAIPSHTAVGLQHSLDLLSATYQRAGLIINTKKTEVLAQSVNTSSAAHPTFTVHTDSLNDVHQFTYLVVVVVVVVVVVMILSECRSKDLDIQIIIS